MGLNLAKITGLQDLVLGVLDRIKLDPKTRAEIETKMIQNQHELAKAQMEYDVRFVEAVNATMREEAKSEKWAQWLWRPVVGFTFSLTVLNNYVLLPYFKHWGLVSIDIPGEVWTAMLVILGAAAATRGWQKVAEVKNGGSR